ncbi:MAG TPA: hypothetical protein DG355_04620 [Candidatus Cloacimonas sp.]|nr:hypothetical protein [Candidatus Cloacimonas sp.]
MICIKWVMELLSRGNSFRFQVTISNVLSVPNSSTGSGITGGVSDWFFPQELRTVAISSRMQSRILLFIFILPFTYKDLLFRVCPKAWAIDICQGYFLLRDSLFVQFISSLKIDSLTI